MASTIAKAYVQIVPTTQGLAGNIKDAFNSAGNDLESIGDQAGASYGSGIMKGIAKLGIGAAIGKTLGDSIKSGADFEQLWGGAEKIFSGMDTSQILNDATNAYKTMGMSANEYLGKINDVGAAFKSTMGDEKGYNTAKIGLQAISDYASGTGKDVGMLSDKFVMITRSTSSYQSIADQFSGILPATSAEFLKQAQATGTLSSQYKSLSEVPVAEYQQAVASALQKGTDALGLTGNTAKEASSTVSGAIQQMGSAWENFKTSLTVPEIDASEAMHNLLNSVQDAIQAIAPMLGEMGPELANALATAVTEIGPMLANMIAKMFSGIMHSIPDIWGKLSDGGKVVFIIGQIAFAFKTLIPVISAVKSAVIAFNAACAANPYALMAIAIAGITAALIGLEKVGIDKFFDSETGQQFLQTIIQIEDEIESAGGVFNYVGQKIKESFASMGDSVRAAISNIKSSFSGIWDGISSGLSEAVSAVRDKISAIASAVKEGLKKALSAVSSWGSDMASKGKSAVQQMIDSITKTIAELPQRLKQAGIQMAAGLAEGFTSKINAAKDKILSGITNITDAVKEALEIHSPSRVWADQIGAQMAAGVGVGFNAQMPKVNANIKSDMAETLRTQNSQIKSALMQRPNMNSFNNGNVAEEISRAIQNITVQNNVTLEGDAGKLFTAMQNNNRIYKNTTGRSAFA